jgi:DNA-binding Xre family transcriptional regulator
MEIVEKIAKNINKYRKDMSVDKLGKIADIPSSTIWNILSHQVNNVKITTLIAIAKALNCTVDDLIK